MHVVVSQGSDFRATPGAEREKLDDLNLMLEGHHVCLCINVVENSTNNSTVIAYNTINILGRSKNATFSDQSAKLTNCSPVPP